MTNQTDKKAFDIHTRCAGYINRIRLVTPSQGNPYWAATICALRGLAGNDGKYKNTYFDVSIVGSLAIERVQELEKYQNDNLTIFVTCKIGDIYADTFVYSKGKKAGQTGVSIKGRLLKIETAKIEGTQYEFTAQPEEADDKQQNSNESNTPDSSKSENSDQNDPDGQWKDQSDKDYRDGKPIVVKLEKTDPKFLEKKAKLKQNGYRFDNKDEVWKLPEVA